MSWAVILFFKKMANFAEYNIIIFNLKTMLI